MVRGDQMCDRYFGHQHSACKGPWLPVRELGGAPAPASGAPRGLGPWGWGNVLEAKARRSSLRDGTSGVPPCTQGKVEDTTVHIPETVPCFRGERM